MGNDVKDALSDFHDWLAQAVPGAADWPWFAENEPYILRFAEEALRQGRSPIELKAIIAVDLAGKLEQFPPV